MIDQSLPDEEIGGHDGMEKFVRTERFQQLNVGFALDEGLASENDKYRIFYGERCVWCRFGREWIYLLSSK